MAVLVTGGAGYIGSHMTYGLVDRGEKVVVLDNLSTGMRGLVAGSAVFVEGNAGDAALVKKIVATHSVNAIIHFAGSIVVPDSVAQPLTYYNNNTVVARNLIEAAVESGVPHFIFSSTAAVYGDNATDPMRETQEADPISPYGRSKLMTEWMLEDSSHAYGLRHVVLRYFNVAGADAKGRTGQSSPRATHLIKRACQVALGRVGHLDIFGADYPTPDGTGVRDYIHVTDLVAAHILALEHLRAGGEPNVFNCGYGHGSSVRDVISSVERVIGRRLPSREMPRRLGDPPKLVADATKLRRSLGWKPQHDDLDEIVRTAYAWESRLNSAA